jgi:hypothetical protein
MAELDPEINNPSGLDFLYDDRALTVGDDRRISL